MEEKLRTARSLVRRLGSAAGEPSLATAISELRRISKNDPEIRAPLADVGAVPLLAAHLLTSSTEAAKSHEDAAATLLNISIAAREVLMATPGLLDALGAVLRRAPSSPAAAQHAAATLYSLLTVDAYRPIIGAKKPLLASLIALLRTPVTRSIKDGLKALFGLALYPLNRPVLVELGAVPIVFSLIVRDGRSGLVEDATAVVAQVAGCWESVQAFRKVVGVRILVDLVDPATGASGRARENAAAALLNLVMAGGERAAGDVREVEGAVEVIRGLAEGCDGASARGKAKAESLLRALAPVGASPRCWTQELDGDAVSASTISCSPPVSAPSKDL